MIETIRERHHPGAVTNRIGPNFGKTQCNYCGRPWPCDAGRLASALGEIGDAYGDVPAGSPTVDQVLDSLPPLFDTIGDALIQIGHPFAAATGCGHPAADMRVLRFTKDRKVETWWCLACGKAWREPERPNSLHETNREASHA